MPTITLTLPVAGTTITAGLHATNYTAIQSVINGGLDTANWASGKIFAPSKFMQEGATTGQAVVWNGSQWVPATPPAFEFDYAQQTSDQTSTATTAATATAVVTGASVTYDGSTPVWVEFTCPYAIHSVASSPITFQLYDGSTDLGTLCQVAAQAIAGTGQNVYGRRRLTPSAAAHTYSIRMWSANAGTTTAKAGAGGAGVFLPLSMRIVKA